MKKNGKQNSTHRHIYEIVRKQIHRRLFLELFQLIRNIVWIANAASKRARPTAWYFYRYIPSTLEFQLKLAEKNSTMCDIIGVFLEYYIQHSPIQLILAHFRSRLTVRWTINNVTGSIFKYASEFLHSWLVSCSFSTILKLNLGLLKPKLSQIHVVHTFPKCFSTCLLPHFHIYFFYAT